MPARRHHPTRGYSALPALAKCAQFENSGVTSEAGTRGNRIHATIEAFLLGTNPEEAFTVKELRYGGEAGLLEEIEWIHEQVIALYPIEGKKVRELEVEVEVPLLDHAFKEITFGTADYYRSGHLSDLKTGRKSNYRAQMAGLSLALMDRDGLDSMKVSLIWSMAREVETWTWTRDEVEHIVWPIIEAHERGDAPKVNSKCCYCKKKGTCDARIKTVNTLPFALSKAGSLEKYFEDSTPQKRGELLRKISDAKAWCSEAERTIESWALANPEANLIEGYKVGVNTPKRQWKDEVEALNALSAMAVKMGRPRDALLETKLAGITKVQEIMGKSKPVKELVDSLLYQPEGKPVLIEDWTGSKTKEKELKS